MSHTTSPNSSTSARVSAGPVKEAGTIRSTAVPAQRDQEAGSRSRAVDAVLAVIRLSLGWVFLWAFLDKTFGLGHETAKADSWLEGGSPSNGFLSFATAGPFKGFYNDLAGQTWVDWIFMLGLLGIGAALILGVTMRLAAGAGVLMLVMMWTAVLPPENNLFMDDHLVYALVLVLLALLHAGRPMGLGTWWEQQPIVRRFGWLA